MVWADISIDGRTDLYVIDRGSLTGVRYRDAIGAIGDDFILMDDNARPHRLWLSISIWRGKQLFVWTGQVDRLT